MTYSDARPASSIAAATASGDSRPVKVNILGKELQMACTEGSEDDLHRAAQYVNQSMSAFRTKNKSLSVEKIAIVTAINIANDLLNGKSAPDTQNVLSEQLQSLSARIDSVLEDDH